MPPKTRKGKSRISYKGTTLISISEIITEKHPPVEATGTCDNETAKLEKDVEDAPSLSNPQLCKPVSVDEKVPMESKKSKKKKKKVKASAGLGTISFHSLYHV